MNPAHDSRPEDSSTSARIADYLTRLEGALELLGPAEAADTRAELGSYLAEAERDGRVEEVLGTMGPRNRSPWASSPSAAGFLLVAVGIWPWYYRRSRNRPGHNQSVGRNVAGLRLVRAGGDARVVRASDMPRGRRGMTRAGAFIRFIVAFWIEGGMAYMPAYSLIRGHRTPPELTLSVVAQDAGSAVGATTQLTAAIAEAVSADRTATKAPRDLLEDTAIETYPKLLESAMDNSAYAYELHRTQGHGGHRRRRVFRHDVPGLSHRDRGDLDTMRAPGRARIARPSAWGTASARSGIIST